MKLIEDFNDVPSLEFMSASQFVITIWNRPDIVHGITEALNEVDENEVERVLEEIDDRVLPIFQSIEGLPFRLRNNLEVMITPIGHHIMAMRTFANFSPYFESSRFEFPVDHWTSYGTVDIKRLDKILVQDERRETSFRYYLACNDCFEEDIVDLFPLLSNREKRKFLAIRKNRELLSYWTHRMQNNLPSFLNKISRHEQNFLERYNELQIVLKYSMVDGSKSGIEYILRRLGYGELYHVITRNLSFLLDPFTYSIRRRPIPFRCMEHHLDAFYFLMSQVGQNRRVYLHPVCFLLLVKFLSYPFFGLVRGCSQRNGRFLTQREAVDFMRAVQSLENRGVHFFHYDIIHDFWVALPEERQEAIRLYMALNP